MSRQLSMYTDAEEGGCVDVATVLIHPDFSLVRTAKLKELEKRHADVDWIERIRYYASCLTEKQ